MSWRTSRLRGLVGPQLDLKAAGISGQPLPSREARAVTLKEPRPLRAGLCIVWWRRPAYFAQARTKRLRFGDGVVNATIQAPMGTPCDQDWSTAAARARFQIDAEKLFVQASLALWHAYRLSVMGEGGRFGGLPPRPLFRCLFRTRLGNRQRGA